VGGGGALIAQENRLTGGDYLEKVELFAVERGFGAIHAGHASRSDQFLYIPDRLYVW
jgi:hypothetical protein